MDKGAQKVHRAIQKKFRLHKRKSDNLPWGALRRVDRNQIGEVLHELGYNKGVEVGVRTGRFSKKLCTSNPNLHLTCVDPWDNYHFRYPQEKQDAIFKTAIERLTPFIDEGRVSILRKSSMDALDDFEDESLDFTFIDGNHTFDFAMMDIICWSKKIKINGIVAVHDYYNFTWAGIVKAVDAYTHCHNINPWYTTKELEPTAIWVKPRPNPYTETAP